MIKDSVQFGIQNLNGKEIRIGFSKSTGNYGNKTKENLNLRDKHKKAREFKPKTTGKH